MDRWAQAGGPYLIPIMKNLYSIPRYLQARPTVYTLLSIQLEPNIEFLIKRLRLLEIDFTNNYPPCIAQYVGGSW